MQPAEGQELQPVMTLNRLKKTALKNILLFTFAGMELRWKSTRNLIAGLFLLSLSMSASDTLSKAQKQLRFGISYFAIFGPSGSNIMPYSHHLGLVLNYRRFSISVGPSSAYRKTAWDNPFPVGVFLDIKYQLNKAAKRLQFSLNLFSNYFFDRTLRKMHMGFELTQYEENVLHSVYSSFGPQIKLKITKSIALDLSALFLFIEYGKWGRVAGFENHQATSSSGSAVSIGGKPLQYSWLLKTGLSYTFR